MSAVPNQTDDGRICSSLSIVIPAYNEENSLPGMIDSLQGWDPPAGIQLLEILVVDDGSTDGTHDLAKELILNDPRIKVIKNVQNRGKGYSVCRGMLASTGDIAGFTDADLAYDPVQYNPLLASLNELRADIALGTRRMTGSTSVHSQPLTREYSSTVFQLLIKFMGLKTASDSQCGLKFFRREAITQIFPKIRCRGFAFDVELLYIAHRLGLTYIEIPVTMNAQRPSTIQLYHQVPRMIWDLLKIRFRSY
jgi:dolichyl-phosphate beta-glucosyltransferase